MDASLQNRVAVLAREIAGEARTVEDVNKLMRLMMKSALERMLDAEMDVHLGRRSASDQPRRVRAGTHQGGMSRCANIDDGGWKGHVLLYRGHVAAGGRGDGGGATQRVAGSVLAGAVAAEQLGPGDGMDRERKLRRRHARRRAISPKAGRTVKGK